MSAHAASSRESDRLASTLAEAFGADPVFGWMIPAAARRRARLKRFFAIELDAIVFPEGEAWTNESLDGAALCLPPGKWKMPAAVVFGSGPSYVRVFGLRVLHSLTLLTRMEACHYREPHYYIPYVGVRPSRQGRGIGTELMRPILERSDREGLPTYLEATCERNAALYAALGFERQEELRVLGSPPLLPMLRPPRGA